MTLNAPGLKLSPLAELSTPRFAQRSSSMKLSSTLFLTLLLGAGSISNAQGVKPKRAPATKRTDAEQYVLDQVKNGDPADFGLRSQKELSGTFVRELLINADKHIPISGHGITILRAVFTGDVDLINEEIPNDTSLNGVFEGEFNASQSHFLKTLDLSGSIFKRSVDFENAVIEFDYTIDNCKFECDSPSNGSAYFKSIRVGRDWSMQPAPPEQSPVQFCGPVDFTQSDVGGKLLANSVIFQSGADFDSAKVKGETILREAVFGGGEAKFNDTHFNNLFLNEAHFENTSLLDLTRMQVESVFLDNVLYPNNGSVKIEGMTFKAMSPASWDGLRDLRKHSDYDPEFYTNLETLFRSHGHTSEADRVFIDKQRRDRSGICLSILHNCQRGRWAFSLLEDWLTGYGRSLENLLLWSVGFVLFGTVVFRRTAMKRLDGDDGDDVGHHASPQHWIVRRWLKGLYRRFFGRLIFSRTGMKRLEGDEVGRQTNLRYWRIRRWLKGLYGGFWYSLDLFLPIIELGEREKWNPKDDRPLAIFYKRVHAMIGHLFVPIGLAAWTGIIK